MAYILVADIIGPASVNLTQFVPKAAVLCEITLNDGTHWAVQGHSRSPSLVHVPIKSPYTRLSISE